MSEATAAAPVVWLVEDSALEAEAARRALAAAFEVRVFADGPSMIEQLGAPSVPDVVTLDWHLPLLSGIDICHFLRDARRGLDLGLVIVTGIYTKTEDVVQGLAAGADDYVVKPYAEAELVARVSALVRAKRLRARAAQAESTLRAVLDQLPDPLLVVDDDGILRSMNGEAARRFDREGKAVGQPVGAVVPGLSPSARTVELDGCIFECAARRVVLPEGEGPFSIVTLRDVTEARRQIATRDQFLAMLAHELRNPLAPILTALELTKLNPDPGTAQRSRTLMERQVMRLVRLVDDLIDISRVTRGRIQLHRETTDVKAVVARSVEDVQSLLDAQRHRLAVAVDGEPGPLHVHADPARLEQVFTNLLHNAAKYTPPGGHVRIEAGREGEHVFVRISDDGIGIDPAMLARIFELFVQVDSSIDRERGGLGIGLTLARQLIEMQDGTIQAESAGLGRGACFTVRLPASAAAVAAAPAPAKRVAAARGVRVLVVDDNADAAELLGAALAMHGHEVRIAIDGARALEVASEFAPDVVLLDIGLPEMDGYEVARRLRAAPSTATSFIVAVTGYGGQADRERTAEAGFDGHLVKPIELQAVHALLDARFPPRGKG